MEKEKENGQRLERQVRLQMRLFKSFKLQTQMLYVLSYGITFGATGTAYFTGIMLDLILDINLFSLVMCCGCSAVSGSCVCAAECTIIGKNTGSGCWVYCIYSVSVRLFCFFGYVAFLCRNTVNTGVY